MATILNNIAGKWAVDSLQGGENGSRVHGTVLLPCFSYSHVRMLVHAFYVHDEKFQRFVGEGSCVLHSLECNVCVI